MPQSNWQFVLPKVKVSRTSAIAIGVDYLLYLNLVEVVELPKVPSGIFSSGVEMIINFALHKRVIFSLKRKVEVAFLISLGASIRGIALGTTLIYVLSLIPWFNDHQYFTKLQVTGIIFFFNFYIKKLAFKQRLRGL